MFPIPIFRYRMFPIMISRYRMFPITIFLYNNFFIMNFRYNKFPIKKILYNLIPLSNFNETVRPGGAAAAKFDISAKNGAYLVCRKRILITFWKSRIVHRFSSIPVGFHALSCMLMDDHA